MPLFWLGSYDALNSAIASNPAWSLCQLSSSAKRDDMSAVELAMLPIGGDLLVDMRVRGGSI